ncbi:tail fiber domain-containing protein [Jiulongibacter sp. NS-SX5]|uniref:tail fiber domain-containing protein n=1 Tax=Jiulongibacter sp. NS-SX5 TaxID=3463854 RepID=UPI0040581335
MKLLFKITLISLITFTGFAQSVMITPGSQTLNGNSTNNYQLDVYGNGLVVQETEEFGTISPNNIVNGNKMVYDANLNRFIISSGSKMEYDSTGRNSITFGNGSIAKEYGSVAIGDSCISEGHKGISIGHSALASGYESIAIGNNAESSGSHSYAFGSNTTATSGGSIAIGYNAISSGTHSKAFCNYCETTGSYTTSMGGNMNTNNKDGTFMIGDSPIGVSTHYANVANRMIMRFRNGYYLYTDGAASVGAKMLAGDNSWSTASDSTLKENFIPSNGEEVLNAVAQMRVGTWNYKTQDPSQHRHWGVMAQDFYKHFGHDAIGTIGSDTLIASADFDGVAFAAIKALEERTRTLEKENLQLKQALKSLESLRNEMILLKAAVRKPSFGK